MKNAKSKQRIKTHTVVPPAGLVPFGSFLRNDSPHNFANRAKEFLTAAKILYEQGDKMPNDPTYLLTFLALELFLKTYLLGKGATLEHVSSPRKIGHSVQQAMKEAEGKGLTLNIDPKFHENVMQFSEAYKRRDFQYRSNRQALIVLPGNLIKYVERVKSVSGY
jgi:hypothetical protein